MATETTTTRPAPPEHIRAVPVRHPGRYVAAVVIGVLVAMFVHMLVTNPVFQWGFMFDNMFTPAVLRGVRTTLIMTVLAMVIGVLLSSSVWVLLVPLLVLVSCTGVLLPNSTALALEGQAASAGAASALFGLLQFAIGAAVPPLASLGGVTAVVMAATILGTTTVAALIHHPEVDAASGHSTALLHAAHRGHWRCVQLLLPVSDPNERNAEALWRACKHRHARVVRLLGPVSDTSGWEGWIWQGFDPRQASLVSSLRWKTRFRTGLVEERK